MCAERVHAWFSSREDLQGEPSRAAVEIDALVVWVADGAGCASWLHEASVAFGEYYVLLRVLKNDLGSGDERCWKRGVCVTALAVWEVALCAVRHKGALDVVSDNLVVVNLDSDV